jgi:hypothetical protein
MGRSQCRDRSWDARFSGRNDVQERKAHLIRLPADAAVRFCDDLTEFRRKLAATACQPGQGAREEFKKRAPLSAGLFFP